jgi:HEAT repeat protein
MAQQILRSVFRVYPGEGIRVWLMLCYSLAAVGGVVITGQLASRALFLSSLSRGDIAFKFILPPLALMAATAFYTRVAHRFERARLIIFTSSTILIGAGLFRILLEFRQDFTALCALFVFFDLAAAFVILQFWTFAGDIFNAREAKRLFSLIAGGSTISNIAFGAALSSWAHATAPENLIFVIMVSLSVCIACVWFLSRKYQNLLPATDGGSRDTVGDGGKSELRDILHSPLVVSMGGILVLGTLVSNIADYQLDLALQAHFGGGGQDMVEFLGRFRLLGGIGAGFLQFFLAGRLLERFGIAAALMILPAAMGLSSGMFFLGGGLLWAAVPRGCDVVFKYTINDSAFNLLYLPIESQMRAKVKAILDGIVKPPLVSLLGVAFLVVGQWKEVSVSFWALPIALLVLPWVGCVWRASKHYVDALAESVHMRRLNLDEEVLDLVDESSTRVLQETLRLDDAAQVIHAVLLLPRIPQVKWSQHVVDLLQHPDADVRVVALKYLAEHGTAELAGRVENALGDGAIEVRAAAIGALCALEGHRALPKVLPFLASDVLRIRAAAVLSLIKNTGLDGLLHAGESLKGLLADKDWQARLEGVKVLEALQVPSFYHPLIDLLEDKSVEVQIATLRAAAHIGAPELVPYLVPQLDDPLKRWYATEAVASCAGDDLEMLDQMLGELNWSSAVRLQLVRIISRKPERRAMEILLARMDVADDLLRGAVYEGLIELRAAGFLSTQVEKNCRRILEREFELAYTLHVVYSDLALGDGDFLLEETLKIQSDLVLVRIFSLMDLLYAEITSERTRAFLDHRDGRLRAAVIELVDNVVERKIKEYLMPLLDAGVQTRLDTAENLLRIPRLPAAERLRELVEGNDTWLRSCALHSIGGRGLVALGAVVENAMRDGTNLVAETAGAAYCKLYGGEGVERALGKGLKARDGDSAAPMERPKGAEMMALSTLEKVIFLKSASLFEKIPSEKIGDIVPIAHEVSIKKGETFIKKGDEGNCLYILVEGKVVVTDDLDGDKVLRVVETREVIGELAVLSKQFRTAYCTALTDVVALQIHKEDFWKLINEQPQIAIEVMQVLVRRYID